MATWLIDNIVAARKEDLPGEMDMSHARKLVIVEGVDSEIVIAAQRVGNVTGLGIQGYFFDTILFMDDWENPGGWSYKNNSEREAGKTLSKFISEVSGDRPEVIWFSVGNDGSRYVDPDSTELAMMDAFDCHPDVVDFLQEQYTSESQMEFRAYFILSVDQWLHSEITSETVNIAMSLASRAGAHFVRFMTKHAPV